MACCVLSALVVSNCHLLIQDENGFTRHEFILEETKIYRTANSLQITDTTDSISFDAVTVLLLDAGIYADLDALETYVRGLILACDCDCIGL